MSSELSTKNLSTNDPSIFLVSGKGGVGKSTVAAALGQHFAAKSYKTLVVELGDNSYFDLVYEQKIGFSPIEVSPNLDLAVWSGESCLKEFIAHYIPIPAIVNLFFENKIMRTLVKAAPALQELALVGKLTSGPRKVGPPLQYDRIVLDGYSSGHFLSLLRVPKAMAETITLGPMGAQSQSIHETLTNPKLCHFLWVTTTEELPVQEACEFNELIREEFHIQPTLVINKRIETLLTVDLEGKSSKFAKFLRHLLVQEERSKSQLSALKAKTISLPLSLEPLAQNRIKALSRYFGEYEVLN